MSSFVGREQELGDVADLLAVARLVTLTGSPGVGKTRLAVEAADRARPAFPDGVWFVDLSAFAEPSALPTAVASALRIRTDADGPPTDRLVTHLRHLRLLLVLDNCEHLIGACAEMVQALLRDCGGLSVLATSRERLAISGERAWRVPSLSVPDADSAMATEAMVSFAGVRLFVERARATRPAFRMTRRVTMDVAAICRRLDGVPLAIELAAGRVDVLAPAEILDRLDDRFALLTSRSRSGLPRHQTLRAAVEWSYGLLPGPEQAVLRRVSVFAGGFTLAAAEEVATGGDAEAPSMLGLISGLVAKSLVCAESVGPRTRYRLLETIRVYAADRLEDTGEAVAARRRHTEWCNALAEGIEPQLTGAGQKDALHRLDEEHDNFRAAFDWACAAGHAPVALAMAGSLTLYWRVRGNFGEGSEWLERAIRVSIGAAAPLQAKALWGAGLMAHMVGDNAAAVERLEESLGIYRGLGDGRGCARALLVLGNARHFLGDDPGALGHLEESVALARQVGDSWCLALALAMSGFALVDGGEVAAATPLFEESLGVARRAGDFQSLAMALNGLGMVALAEGRFAAAEAHLGEGLSVARELGEPYEVAKAVSALGALAAGWGNHGHARELLEEGLRLARMVSSHSAVVPALCALAVLARAEGDERTAAAQFSEAASLARQAGQPSAPALLGLGQLAAARGDAPQARALVDEARASARASGDQRSVAEALYELGNLAREEGDDGRASILHHEALRARFEVGHAPGVADSLEAVAGLAAADARFDHAARVLAAAASLRSRNGYERWATQEIAFDQDVETVRRELGPQRFSDDWVKGAGLSLEEAVSYASKGRGPRRRPDKGWASLTRAESNVVALATEGLTNAEIGERLFISPRTVQSHLSSVFAKLGVRSRRDLALRAAERGA
ncbi:MAG: helix-turn-helix transcriptional regulator [Acidimicrobiales bacterium]